MRRGRKESFFFFHSDQDLWLLFVVRIRCSRVGQPPPTARPSAHPSIIIIISFAGSLRIGDWRRGKKSNYGTEWQQLEIRKAGTE